MASGGKPRSASRAIDVIPIRKQGSKIIFTVRFLAPVLVIDLLAMARVVSKVTHSTCSGLPLQADFKENVYKLLFLDVGLTNAVCIVGWETIQAAGTTDLVNAGTSVEQFIGQHLQYLLARRPNRELTYWLREGRSNNAEVDYLVELGGRLCQ